MEHEYQRVKIKVVKYKGVSGLNLLSESIPIIVDSIKVEL